MATNPTDPIHQFQISNIVPIEIGGLDFSFTNSALFMVADGRRGDCLPVLFDPRARPRAEPHAVGERALLRVRCQHAARRGGLRRHAVLSVRLLAVHVHPGRQPARHGPVFLHGDQPSDRDLRAVPPGDGRRRGLRPDEARPALLQTLRARGRAGCRAAAGRADRGGLVPVAAGVALGSSLRQHAGGAHHAEGLRRLRGVAERLRRARGCRCRSFRCS